MMRELAIVVGAAVAATAPGRGVLTTARVPVCATGANHQRWALKNRELGATEDVTVTTVADILARAVPDPAVDVNDQPQDNFEQSVWRLDDAVVCLVKQSADDCDLHVEIADSVDHCAVGPRMIVELPASYGKEAQNALLDAAGIHVLGRGATRFGASTREPRPVTVVGWGFYDYAHRCARDAAGCNHGSALVASLAELHPARVEQRASSGAQ